MIRLIALHTVVVAMLLVAACTTSPAATPGATVAPGPGPTKAPVQVAPLGQPVVAPPITRAGPASVKIDLEIKELAGRLDDGSGYTYWTFGGTVPGPMLRVREGDTVDLTLKNPASSSLPHNIDLHAVNGPGGGAVLTNVNPGQEKSFRFKALNPGLYIYHCAFPPVPYHVAKGMYGLILVEPPEGLTPVDKEFYVVQGDLYTDGERGAKGMQGDSLPELVEERADYVVFNGSVGALTGDNALKVDVGDTVRIFFGVGGPNVTSSFHIIGEIFDLVYPEGALGEPHRNVQSTLVPAGGAAILEFKVDVPGTYLLVDHSLSRLFKGAVGQMVATGPENPQIFGPLP
ncbi:MAG TPA: copper-containing nitrite reductase [Dehalococcoidia bacterium]|nr:copper-containing nitrite reductase [Dehalococcoidia bacterium]